MLRITSDTLDQQSELRVVISLCLSCAYQLHVSGSAISDTSSDLHSNLFARRLRPQFRSRAPFSQGKSMISHGPGIMGYCRRPSNAHRPQLCRSDRSADQLPPSKHQSPSRCLMSSGIEGDHSHARMLRTARRTPSRQWTLVLGRAFPLSFTSRQRVCLPISP